MRSSSRSRKDSSNDYYICSVCEQRVLTKHKGLHNKSYHQIGTKKSSKNISQPRQQGRRQIDNSKDAPVENIDILAQQNQHHENHAQDETWWHQYQYFIWKTICFFKTIIVYIFQIGDFVYSFVVDSFKTILVMTILSLIVYGYKRLEIIKTWIKERIQSIWEYLSAARGELYSLFSIPNNSPLHQAVDRGDKDEVSKLFNTKIDVFKSQIETLSSKLISSENKPNWVNEQLDKFIGKIKEKFQQTTLDLTSLVGKQQVLYYVQTVETHLQKCLELIYSKEKDGLLNTLDVFGNFLTQCRLAQLY